MQSPCRLPLGETMECSAQLRQVATIKAESWPWARNARHVPTLGDLTTFVNPTFGLLHFFRLVTMPPPSLVTTVALMDLHVDLRLLLRRPGSFLVFVVVVVVVVVVYDDDDDDDEDDDDDDDDDEDDDADGGSGHGHFDVVCGFSF